MAVSRALRFQILRRDNHTCQSCGRSAPDVKLQVDHVVPEALGGRTESSNLRSLCADCNAGKSATPPDAAVVAQVAADAERWAAAQAIATTQLLANRDARNEVHRQFVARWTDWESRLGEDLPFEPGWQRSVDSFIGQGLPVETLLDCIDRAMRSTRVPAGERFRYMCGVAWSTVRDLREATAFIAAGHNSNPGSPKAPPPSDGGYELACELLEAFDQTEVERFADAAARAAEGPLDGPSQTIEAAKYAVRQITEDALRLDVAIWELIRDLPSEIADRAAALARAEIQEYMGDSYDGTDETVHILQHISAEFAAIYLESLDTHERAEWIAAATESVPWAAASWAITLEAARYAKHVKSGGGPRPHLCANSGDHGAMCPRRAGFKIWIEDCGNCSDQGQDACRGHVGLCARHLEAAVEGRAKNRTTEQVYRLTDFAEVLPSDDPWAVAE